MIILLAYSFFGAVILHHAEYEREQQLHQQLARYKNHCVAGIVNASAAALSQRVGPFYVDDDWYYNLTATVETLVDVYVDHKEHLRPISKAPEWTYWGALFFCGTVYTTIGRCRIQHLWGYSAYLGVGNWSESTLAR